MKDGQRLSDTRYPDVQVEFTPYRSVSADNSAGKPASRKSVGTAVLHWRPVGIAENDFHWENLGTRPLQSEDWRHLKREWNDAIEFAETQRISGNPGENEVLIRILMLDLVRESFERFTY